MEINQYLILLLVIFSVDTLVLPSFAKNENESDLVEEEFSKQKGRDTS